MGVLDKLAFWQSKAFFTLENEAGRLVEREAGPSRPKAVPFVKGGRRAALARAGDLWPGAAVEAAAVKTRVKAMRQRVAAESGEDEGEPEPRGERPDEGQPLEDEEPVVISERPARISSRRGSVTGSRFERITPDTMGRHGLPR